MSEEQLWSVVWRCITVITGTLILSIAGCVANTHWQISRDIRSGADPMIVACAHNVDLARDHCLVTAAKR